MKLLDRYVLRNFVEPFLLCFFGFLAIWLVFDLQDNMQEFLSGHASFRAIGLFYLSQLPQIVLISLPVGLLLALIFCLSRMSRFNEIISMLAAGRSVVRTMIPLIVIGALCSAALFALNYQLAPQAESGRKVALDQISRGRRPGEVEAVTGYLFRDRMNGRTWYIQKFRPGALQFDGVHITQQDATGTITRKWYAGRATYDQRTKTWVLNRGLIVDFNQAGEVTKMDNFEKDYRAIHDWTETPWRIGSSHQEAQTLSVPELRAYLENNADFPAVQLAPFRTYLQHRLAFPMQCFVIVFLAGPLSIVFSRRGVIVGVAGAMLLYAALLLTTYFLLALGKGARMDPMIAAWAPNAFFLVIGVIMLYLRGSNRELPKLFAKRK